MSPHPRSGRFGTVHTRTNSTLHVVGRFGAGMSEEATGADVLVGVAVLGDLDDLDAARHRVGVDRRVDLVAVADVHADVVHVTAVVVGVEQQVPDLQRAVDGGAGG